MSVAAPHVVLRPMGERDVDAVRALDALVQPTPWSEVFLRDQLADAETWTLLVAEGADGAPVGHAALMVVADEGHITSVSVDPNHQRHGVGACDVVRRPADGPGLQVSGLEGTENAADRAWCDDVAGLDQDPSRRDHVGVEFFGQRPRAHRVVVGQQQAGSVRREQACDGGSNLATALDRNRQAG